METYQASAVRALLAAQMDRETQGPWRVVAGDEGIGVFAVALDAVSAADATARGGRDVTTFDQAGGVAAFAFGADGEDDE